nr:helix-turn-helix transcriptional regulator [Microbacterium immunditiarum]
MRAHGFFTLQDRKVRVADGPASLTPAERRVADLVGRGMSNPAIAQTLSISPRTVETHVAHIFTKLGIKSRVELAVRAAGGLVS